MFTLFESFILFRFIETYFMSINMYCHKHDCNKFQISYLSKKKQH